MKRRPITYRSLWIYYYRYKDTVYFTVSVFSCIIIISLLLFWKIIFPQVGRWFSIREEVIATRERIKNIQDNILFISRLEDSVLNENVSIAVMAYPSEKDFGGVLNAISNASSTSGVSLSDYIFEVGSLSGTDTKVKITPLELTVKIDGDLQSVERFINIVQEKIPLSQITSVESRAGSSTVTLQFPYKPFPKLLFTDSDPIKPLSASDTELLLTLSEWR